MLLLPFLYSTCINPIDLYEMELGSIVSFLFVLALFFFFFFLLPTLFLVFLEVLGIMYGLAVLIGVLLRKLSIRIFGRQCPIVYLVS